MSNINKCIFIIISLAFNFILFLIFFFLTSIVLDSSFFFNTVIICFFILLINLIVLKYSKLDFNNFEIIIMSISIVLFLFIFGIFGPVFIDRSISYKILFDIQNNNIITLNDYRTNSYENKIMIKRIIELEKLGLIHKNSSKYELSKFGIFFTKNLLFIKKITIKEK